jgi:CubicO group peptidase (beta-lactamase class C family)
LDEVRLDAFLRDRSGRDLFAGVARITRGGVCQFVSAYGPAARAWDVPNTIDTRFDTASITKLFTAVTALQVVEEGLLSLDVKAVDYLGLQDTAIHPEANLGHLLTHTSGIGDDADEEAGEDYADIWKERTSYLVRSTSDLLAQFAQKPSNFPPGEGCRYCNAGYILVGLMVEEATGVPYRRLVERRVFDRAGMADSGFFAMDAVVPRVAEGADLVEGRWVRNIYSYPPIGSPDGGAHATAADLGRFIDALRQGDLLGEVWTERFFRPVARHSVNDAGERYFGYGLEFQFDSSGDLLYFEKEGINAGTSAVIRHYPRIDTTVVLLSNMRRGVWEPRRLIHSMIIGAGEDGRSGPVVASEQAGE